MRRPLVPSAVAFICGIQAIGSIRPTSALCLLALVVLATLSLARRRSVLAAIAYPAVFFAAGGATRSLSVAVPGVDGLRAEDFEQPRVVEAIIVAAPEVGPRGARSFADLAGIGEGPVPTALRPVSGRIRIRIAGVQAADALCAQPGDRVRVFGKLRKPRPELFPGGFSARAYAQRKGFLADLFVRSNEHCVVVERARGSAWLWALERLRLRAHAAIDATLPRGRAGLVRALATGDRSGLDPLDRDAIRDAGLAHLTAVSGFHLGVMAWLWLSGLGALFRRWPWLAETVGARRAAALCALPVTIAYPLFVGCAPSAVRAGLMLALVLGGTVVHRGQEIWSVLAAALMVMAACDPTCLEDPGVQLSFSAVASLLTLPVAFERALDVRPAEWSGPARFIWTAAVGSFAATLGTAPFIALHFGRLSVVGLIANIPAGLLAGAAVPLALVGALVGAAEPSVGAPVLWLSGWPAQGLLHLAHSAARVPGAVWVLPKPTAVEMGLFAVVLVGIAQGKERPWARRTAGVAGLALVLWTLSLPVARHLTSTTRVTFLPVGQGDAAVLELPRGQVVVIDAGPPGRGTDAGERILAPFLRHRRISRVHLFIATHPHADHVGGFPGLAGAVPVDRVWWSGDVREGPREALELLASVPSEPLTPGLTFRAGEAVLEVLAPSRDLETYASVNDASVVVQLRHGVRRVLFTGDAEEDGEERLLRERGAAALRADVLKAGHHGSRTSSTEVFLSAVSPDHVVISCGLNNGFGFPHGEAVARLARTGARLWRTDLMGAITVITDGQALKVRSYLARSAGGSADAHTRERSQRRGAATPRPESRW